MKKKRRKSKICDNRIVYLNITTRVVLRMQNRRELSNEPTNDVSYDILREYVIYVVTFNEVYELRIASQSAPAIDVPLNENRNRTSKKKKEKIANQFNELNYKQSSRFN